MLGLTTGFAPARQTIADNKMVGPLRNKERLGGTLGQNQNNDDKGRRQPHRFTPSYLKKEKEPGNQGGRDLPHGKI